MPLSEVPADTNTVLTGITNHTRPFLQHLDKLDLTLGTPIRVDEVTLFDSSLLVTLQGSKQIHLIHQVAKNILVALPKAG
jgi:DtxR family Mn-dependent transcriptional regulator